MGNWAWYGVEVAGGAAAGAGQERVGRLVTCVCVVYRIWKLAAACLIILESKRKCNATLELRPVARIVLVSTCPQTRPPSQWSAATPPPRRGAHPPPSYMAKGGGIGDAGQAPSEASASSRPLLGEGRSSPEPQRGAQQWHGPQPAGEPLEGWVAARAAASRRALAWACRGAAAPSPQGCSPGARRRAASPRADAACAHAHGLLAYRVDAVLPRTCTWFTCIPS